MVDLTNAREWTRDVAIGINREGTQDLAFARASQNVVAMAMLLDTLPAPSADGVDMVYLHLMDILGITADQQEESSLQRRAKALISSPSRSKASRQKATTELSVAGTASSPAQIPTHVRLSHTGRQPEPQEHHQARQGDVGAQSEHRVHNPRRGGCDDWEERNLSSKGLGPNAFGSNVRDA
jgi:hypothetical protein